MKHAKQKHLDICYFGSSTGAASALVAAGKFHISSIVVRSGRTDLVEDNLLSQVVAPCLFNVGGKEETLIKINKDAIKKLKNVEEKQLHVVSNASHLFEEEGYLEDVANISTEWFKKHIEVPVP